jgi:hypothetical protein
MSEEQEVNKTGFVGRLLYDHKGNRFNRECIDVLTADERGTDNAHHAYTINVRAFEQPKDAAPTLSVTLQFQNGSLSEVGGNGITDQALLAIILDRKRSFNDGPFRCRENSMVITKLEEALMWEEKRGNDRARRGVEGERMQ